MTELPAWRRCPKCGAVEVYTGSPKFSPDTVFITFIPTRHLRGPNILVEIPTALQCPNCGHIVEMQ